MNCEETRQYFMDLIYPEEQMFMPSGFKEHFAGCSLCATEYLRLLETRRALNQWPDEEPIRQLVFAEAPKERQPVPRLRWLSWRPAPALAFGFTVLLVFLALMRIHISWENGRFSLQSGLIFSESGRNLAAQSQPGQADLLQAVDRMLNESEQRQNQQMLVLLQRISDNLEFKQQMDMYQVRDDLGLMRQNYHQALEKNNMVLEQAARLIKQNRY